MSEADLRRYITHKLHFSRNETIRNAFKYGIDMETSVSIQKINQNRGLGSQILKPSGSGYLETRRPSFNKRGGNQVADLLKGACEK